jgi:serine-type D-Ala-D-Ala carboxypeptidase (penicillin-binding protein 5/6)
MRLLYLSMLAVILLGSMVFTTNAKEAIVQQIELPVFHREAAVAPLPKLEQSDYFPLLSAQGVLAVDIDSGVVLYEKDADKTLLPASTTKIVTALTALEHYGLDEVITVQDPSVVGQKMGLTTGEQITVRDLIHGLLIFSANDAAEVLADAYPEGREAFMKKMNEKAYELAMYDSLFVNPSGLEDVGHLSTARDLTRAALIAIKDPLISEIVKTEKAEVSSIDGKIVHRLTNTNELLGEVDGVLGVKTGWTENARENLVTYVERDNRRVVIALLGSQDRFGETKELIEWIFTNYEWEKIEVPVYSTP